MRDVVRFIMSKKKERTSGDRQVRLSSADVFIVIIFTILRCAHGRKGCRCRSEGWQGALFAGSVCLQRRGEGEGNDERPPTRQRRNVTRRTAPLLRPTPEQLFALRPCRIRRPFRLDARGSVVRA